MGAVKILGTIKLRFSMDDIFTGGQLLYSMENNKKMFLRFHGVTLHILP